MENECKNQSGTPRHGQVRHVCGGLKIGISHLTSGAVRHQNAKTERAQIGVFSLFL